MEYVCKKQRLAQYNKKHIPINDVDAWKYYPNYRWIYNKMQIIQSNNLLTCIK